MEVMKKLRPPFWFSASLQAPERQNEGFHGSRPRQPFPRPAVCRFEVRFPALVAHGDGTFTRFLALERCRGGKEFLQVGGGIFQEAKEEWMMNQRYENQRPRRGKSYEWKIDPRLKTATCLGSTWELGKHLIWKFRSFTKIQRSTSICTVHGLHNNPTTSNKTQQIKQQNKKTSFRRLRRCYV